MPYFSSFLTNIKIVRNPYMLPETGWNHLTLLSLYGGNKNSGILLC
jgi:hypothetical protein